MYFTKKHPNFNKIYKNKVPDSEINCIDRDKFLAESYFIIL